LEKEKTNLSGFLDDLDYLNEVAPVNEKGKRTNPVTLYDFEATSVKDVGNRLQEINMKMDTAGQLVKIGKLFRFDLAVCTNKNYKDQKCNLFCVIGKNDYSYIHNHGYLAGTPEVAAHHFMSALERIPRQIEQAKADIQWMEQDIPVLQKILEDTWNNAPKLQKLKTELDAVERKIGMSLDLINEQINSD